jgi:hypothetical protein
MRCPTCNAETAPTATTCTNCGTAVARKTRRRVTIEDTDSPFAPIGDGPNRRALAAYRCAVFGLIPVLGLVTGPLALVLGAGAWASDRHHPGFTAWGPLNASLILGSLVSLTNGLGVGLMLLGFWRG